MWFEDIRQIVMQAHCHRLILCSQREMCGNAPKTERERMMTEITVQVIFSDKYVPPGDRRGLFFPVSRLNAAGNLCSYLRPRWPAAVSG